MTTPRKKTWKQKVLLNGELVQERKITLEKRDKDGFTFSVDGSDEKVNISESVCRKMVTKAGWVSNDDPSNIKTYYLSSI